MIMLISRDNNSKNNEFVLYKVLVFNQEDGNSNRSFHCIRHYYFVIGITASHRLKINPAQI